METKKQKKPYMKPRVQSEQAPEKQILATGSCSWTKRTSPTLPCVKTNA